MSEPDADVIVVGCGPVGVMTALRATQRGLRVLAFDRSADVYPLPRAIGMDDEVQQLFGRAGLGEHLRRHSTALLGADFVDAAGERVVGVDLPEGTLGPLGYPLMVTFDQPSVERFLRDAAVTAGVDLRLAVEAGHLDTGDDGVRIEIDDGTSATELRSRWLIGADGARSTIRARRGIRLVDQGFDQTWLVVDATLLDPDLPLPTVARQHCDPERITTFVPGHGTRRRWEFRLHPGEYDADRRGAAEPDDGLVTSLMQPWGSADQLQVDRAAVYRFHATVADRFRDGPVFLAGDAAHQMPPFNGQGMCTGLRDAENLTWKLAAVALGGAGDRLLDTYDAERRPHAAGQVSHAVDAGLLIDAIAHDGDAALESGYGQRLFPALAHGLVDGDRPEAGRPLPTPAPGSPPGAEPGDGWTLIRCGPGGGPVGALWDDLGATVLDVPPDTYPGLVEPGLTVVVRPDRQVAAVTDDLAATAARFADQFSG